MIMNEDLIKAATLARDKAHAPYSKFHAVSVPPAVHDKSAELLVILVAINPLGSGQNGIASIVISSTNK